MNTVCWNVRGMGSPRTFHVVRDALRHLKPPLLFLCETKCNEKSLLRLKNSLNYYGCFVVSSQGASGGLCLLWSLEIDVSIRSYSPSHIDSSVKWNSKCWRFTGLYGQPKESLRVHTWELLRRLHNSDDPPWVVGGDMNEIMWDSEKKGGLARAVDLMFNFQSVLDECNLRDMGYRGEIFTWCNRRPVADRIFERLDRFVGNERFFCCFRS